MIRHKAVFEAGRGEIVEKKSRFIAHVQAEIYCSCAGGGFCGRGAGIYRSGKKEILGCQA